MATARKLVFSVANPPEHIIMLDLLDKVLDD